MVSVAAHHIQTYHWKESEGPTVLLCHGWESNAFRWRNLIEKLQAKGFISLVLTLLDMEPLQGRIYMSPFMKHVPVN
jgi:alpha-beta hydrolase superfamily lysophospholipase